VLMDCEMRSPDGRDIDDAVCCPLNSNVGIHCRRLIDKARDLAESMGQDIGGNGALIRKAVTDVILTWYYG
jgi:hypothetical protein